MIVNTPKENLTVDIIASNTRSYDALRLAIEQLDSNIKYQIANGFMPDVLILDFDNNTKAAWNIYHGYHPECLTIVLSTDLSAAAELYRNNENTKLIYLKKPLNKEELKNILDKIHQDNYAALLYSTSPEPSPVATPTTTEIEQKTDVLQQDDNLAEPTTIISNLKESKPDRIHLIREKWDEDPQIYADVCGTRGDIDLSDDTQVKEIKLNITNLLLGQLLTLLKNSNYQDSPFNIQFNNNLLLNFNPREHWIETNCPEQNIIEISRVPIAENYLQIEDGIKYLDYQQNQNTRMDIEQFLWKLALWTYRGQLPEDVELNQRVYLQHWPNLTRLLSIPNAMRIAALWSQQTLELSFTAKTLKIPQRHVFAFYSAANTIGLAGPAKREADVMFEQNTLPEHTKHALLQRVAFQVAKSMGQSA